MYIFLQAAVTDGETTNLCLTISYSLSASVDNGQEPSLQIFHQGNFPFIDNPPTLTQLEFHHTNLQTNWPRRPTMEPLPVTKQHLSETSLLQKHVEPQQSFIFWSHKRPSSQLKLWAAVIVCWLGICAGVIAFWQLRRVPHWSGVCGRTQPAG